MKRSRSLFWLAISLCLLSTVAIGCSDPASDRTDEDATLGSSVLDVGGLDPTSWVAIYDPNRASNGYTLAFYRQRVPILLDMNGRIVHAWPEARTKSRIRLLEDGSILGIGLGRTLVEYGWDGSLTWQMNLRAMGLLPHHDVIRLRNGNTMTIALPDGERTDVLLEVDRSQEVVWKWHSRQHLADFLAASRKNVTHINSVQEISENSHFDAGDERFRPGNLLISARDLNTIFLLDRETGDVVWFYDHELDLQHESVLIEPGQPGAGNIVIFNNGYRQRYVRRQSTILEIDPRDKSVVWQYRSPDFYSPTRGIEQPLPNGNILVSSSRGGRVFEIDRQGATVWEWAPPYSPVRSQRYAFDHAPQFAELDRRPPVPVQPAEGYRHVDRDVYRFSRRGARRTVRIEGKREQILRSNSQCSELILPTAARVEVAYGLHLKALREEGLDSYEARLRLRLRLLDEDREVELLTTTATLGGPSRYHQTIRLGRFSHRRVELCVNAEEIAPTPGRETEDRVFWTSPIISSERDRLLAAGDAPDTDLTPEEGEANLRHLRTMGYVN